MKNFSKLEKAIVYIYTILVYLWFTFSIVSPYFITEEYKKNLGYNKDNDVVDKNEQYDDIEKKQEEEIARKKREEEQKIKEEQEEKNDETEKIEEKEEVEEDPVSKKRKEIQEKDKEKYEAAEKEYSQIMEEESASRKTSIDDINNNMNEKLLKLGFIKTKESEETYANGRYTVKYIGKYPEFSIDLEYPESTKYESKKDLEFFASLYNDQDILKFEEIINKLIHKFDSSCYHSFNIDGYGIIIHVSFCDKLRYQISSSYHSNYKYNTITYIDTMIDKEDTITDNLNRKFYYDAVIDYNKKNYPYYDIMYNYYSRDTNNICRVEFEGRNYYNFEGSFCHSGTSNLYYEFSYGSYSPRVYDIITLEVKGDYFEKNYLEIINNDLKYFSDKTQSNISLTKDNIDTLSNYISAKEIETVFVVNDKFHIEIKHFPDYYFKEYEIKYYIG